ncbi:hypothetical protein CANCADRAFT_104676 [Tortispora caseinolytica NRRL Y-17796]|uniref:Inner centromere protein ARK-binding domain-containing protein n=1 Tax=Tortispora caseinolytica NRRL Y-17796 TaxID=767744 RepID=A0A1E4TEU2_9ASCO|nr:hypothetical protein CANCADRAFT_104676 [Tortispora caseinolytica NRRL Y-17796]
MEDLRNRPQYGSLPWMNIEISNAKSLVQSDVENFSYALRYDLEWLNEYMANVMDSKNSLNNINIADLMKTPGPLANCCSPVRVPATYRMPADKENSDTFLNLHSLPSLHFDQHRISSIVKNANSPSPAKNLHSAERDSNSTSSTSSSLYLSPSESLVPTAPSDVKKPSTALGSPTKQASSQVLSFLSPVGAAVKSLKSTMSGSLSSFGRPKSPERESPTRNLKIPAAQQSQKTQRPLSQLAQPRTFANNQPHVSVAAPNFPENLSSDGLFSPKGQKPVSSNALYVSKSTTESSPLTSKDLPPIPPKDEVQNKRRQKLVLKDGSRTKPPPVPITVSMNAGRNLDQQRQTMHAKNQEKQENRPIDNTRPKTITSATSHVPVRLQKTQRQRDDEAAKRMEQRKEYERRRVENMKRQQQQGQQKEDVSSKGASAIISSSSAKDRKPRPMKPSYVQRNDMPEQDSKPIDQAIKRNHDDESVSSKRRATGDKMRKLIPGTSTAPSTLRSNTNNFNIKPVRKPSSAATNGSSMTKSLLTSQQGKSDTKHGIMDNIVKVSNDKIKFSSTLAPKTNAVFSQEISNNPATPKRFVKQIGTPSAEPTELPEIASDSEDEHSDPVLKDWANSPELRELLRRQKNIDPDQVFGPLPALKMDDIFQGNLSSRYRARQSSAMWNHADQLSSEEKQKYAAVMGYHNGH